MRRLWNDSSTGSEENDARPRAPLPQNEAFDAVVVGAGFTGLIAAIELAERGRRVLVLEAFRVGAGASGATTAKATLLQADRLSQLIRTHNPDVARAYLAANQQGLAWLESFLEHHDVPMSRTSAFTYAASADGVESVHREHLACRHLGLETTFHEHVDLPFPAVAATELPNQLQVNPAELLAALASSLTASGGRLVEHARVTGIDASASGVRVDTAAGSVTADHVVLATASPILDRGRTSAQLTPQRSYLTAFDHDGPVPDGMFVSVEQPSRSVRTAHVAGRRRLLVGGNGHRTGDPRSTRELVDDLTRWTSQHFPGARRTHAWSAQDYHPVGMVPLVATLPWGEGRVHFAGGYSKWGMTSAPVAAKAVADLASGFGPDPPFGKTTLHGRVQHALVENRDLPAALVSTLAQAERRPIDEQRSPSSADVADADETARPESASDALVTTGRSGLAPVGEAPVDGRMCRVSLVCPHLGATLGWNDAEESWDCPWHGSRFAADGTVLEGPATDDLKRL